MLLGDRHKLFAPSKASLVITQTNSSFMHLCNCLEPTARMLVHRIDFRPSTLVCGSFWISLEDLLLAPGRGTWSDWTPRASFQVVSLLMHRYRSVFASTTSAAVDKAQKRPGGLKGDKNRIIAASITSGKPQQEQVLRVVSMCCL